MEDCKGGFPHSEIAGSKGASASPALIAACHVLHRLSTPRHPSEALQRLIVSQQNSCIDCPGDGKRYPPDLCLILLARRCLLEPVLKAYEGPDKFFLHNVNATDPKISCKLVRSRCARPSSVRSTAHSNGAQVALRAVAPERWWSQTESNRRHPACKAGALPTELWPH